VAGGGGGGRRRQCKGWKRDGLGGATSWTRGWSADR
jgi:hypothetical protein